jgi:hypothetical protein
MVVSGVRDIDWQYLDVPSENSIGVGERVSAEAGGLPIYRVMALSDGRAWLREEQGGIDRVAPLSAFHWKACGATPE